MKVNCTILSFDIFGTATHYDEISPCGHKRNGEIRYKKRRIKYPTAVTLGYIKILTDIDLKPNYIYSDRKNNYRAITKHILQNCLKEIKTFSTPTELIELGRSFGDNQPYTT